MSRYYQRKNRSGIILVALCVLSSTLVCAPDTLRSIRIHDSSYGLSLESESYGSAFGGFYSYNMKNKFQLFIHGKILDIVGEAEFPVYDWYTGRYYKTNTSNLILMPLFGGVKYHPFMGQIANNFSPYIMVTAGPTMILNLKDRVGFFKQWDEVELLYSAGGFIGFGLDFLIQYNSYISVAFGYDILPMGRKVDERSDYSGTVLKFMIGKNRKP